MALKILQKQLQRVYDELPQQPGFSAGPLEDDLLHWEATIMGPDDTPYAGGQFYLRMDFTHDFPLRPPKVWFLTKTYHPNIEPDGKICADFLHQEWKPTFSISYIMMAICSLLLHPNAENPADQAVADVYNNNRAQFDEKARAMTLKHAKPDV